MMAKMAKHKLVKKIKINDTCKLLNIYKGLMNDFFFERKNFLNVFFIEEMKGGK